MLRKKKKKSLIFLAIYVAIALLVPFTFGVFFGNVVFIALFWLHGYIIFITYVEACRLKNRPLPGFGKAIRISIIISIALMFFYICVNGMLSNHLFIATLDYPPLVSRGDRFFVSTPKKYFKGDVVFFRQGGYGHITHVERIIGSSKDEVKIEDNKIFVNGRRLNESLYPSNRNIARNEALQGIVIKVPQDCYCVLLNTWNRIEDFDSAYYERMCIIRKENITGKILIKYMPVIQVY